MLIDKLEILQLKGSVLLQNDISLIALTLALTVLLFCRSVSLRRQAAKQSLLLEEQSKHLEEFQIKLDINTSKTEREEHFLKNLQQAEMATELQKSRSPLVHQRNSQRPPERYEYVKSMFQSGLATEEISSALGMSTIEIAQLLKLSSLSKQAEQFNDDKNILSLA
ncbi:MAG TPA: hypothetical protein EYP18_08200 [Desulfobacterales bacterium]|nr:hypothetical protein [Desulfobacterales bacterium]